MQNGDSDPEVVDAMRALPNEIAPPPALEDRIVGSLRARGVIDAPLLRRYVRLRRVISAAAAAIVLLAAGFGIGRSSLLRVDAAPERQYLLLLMDSEDAVPDRSHEAEVVEEYAAWARQLGRAGRLVAAEKLADTGRVVRGSSEDSVMVGASPGQGVASGYFVVTADGYDDAVQIARESPHIRYGGSISVRAIDPT